MKKKSDHKCLWLKKNQVCSLCASFLARRRNIFARSPKITHKPVLKVVSQSEAYHNLPPHLVRLKMAYEVLVYKVTNFYTFFLFLVIGTYIYLKGPPQHKK